MSRRSQQLGDVAFERLGELADARQVRLMFAVHPVVDLRTRHTETTRQLRIGDLQSVARRNDPLGKSTLLRLRCHVKLFAYPEQYFKRDVRLSRTATPIR
jgi:hypothetical protein